MQNFRKKTMNGFRTRTGRTNRQMNKSDFIGLTDSPINISFVQLGGIMDGALVLTSPEDQIPGQSPASPSLIHATFQHVVQMVRMIHR